MIKCSACNSTILKKSQDGKTRLRTRGVFWEQGKCYGICQKCKVPTPLPLSLDKSFGEKFVIPKDS